MILGRDLLIALGMDIKFSEGIIIGGETPYEGCLAPMVDVRNYDFNIITAKTVKVEESFINLYVEECLKSEIKISATRRICRISDAKYKKVDLNKVTTEQYQHINTEECTILLSL